MELSFELYKDNDYDDLKNMILQLYQEDPEGELMNDCKINETIFEFKMNPQKINIYMLKSHGQNIGYAILVYFWSNEYGGNIVTIDELYVIPAAREKGVSTEFFKSRRKTGEHGCNANGGNSFKPKGFVLLS